MSDIEAVHSILAAAPGAQVVVISLDDDPAYEIRAFASGDRGYVHAESASRDVAAAVRAVAGGARFGLVQARSRGLRSTRCDC